MSHNIIVNPADKPVVVDNHNGADLSTAPTTSTTISPNSDHDLENNGRLSPTASRSTSHNHHHLGLGHHQDASNSNETEHPHNHRKPSSVVKRMTTGLFTPEKKIKRHPGWKVSALNLVKSSWINLLLVFIPVSWALHFALDGKGQDTLIFVMCFLAIIPLAGLLGYTTENVTMWTSQTIGGLLNATLGNMVELIVSIIALIKCELQVVQSSLIGSILSNLLLVCGMSFFLGGTRFAEQQFQATSSQLNSSLLLMSVISVLIPAAFHFTINSSSNGSANGEEILTDAQERSDILAMSHGVAIILLLLYVAYLVFQLFTHADLYADEEGPTKSTTYPVQVLNAPGQLKEKLATPIRRRAEANRPPEMVGGLSIHHAIAHVHGTSTALERTPGMKVNKDGRVTSWGPEGPPRGLENHDLEQGDEEEGEEPEMSWEAALISMIIVTVLVGVTAEFLVSSINGMVEANPSLSQEWVGLILLPIVGNAAEHWTAVMGAYKDKLDLSISVAVGSSIQIALFVIPFSVILGWIIGKPLLMLFDPFESAVLFLAVIIVNQALADGRTNWMEGLILFMVYVLIAVAFWYYPGSNTANLIGQAGCS
ncbi:Sodium/calcium exchanger protein-domain-containing protein [Filobasidium floriforme]|uniref:Sodium/calcium exchanger protein-domain-containing protein n=1 Tax=Filobasidium floriforme TaxID=5210 RepID=UPI001E8D9E94|nr:Sodium/calcium exchanger protein-domain-containing protein [Filobasidium floriforme]KAH8079050.1 Sodium/calcium exchanger protein-domain-containing protein [Filobasidium floriforme]